MTFKLYFDNLDNFQYITAKSIFRITRMRKNDENSDFFRVYCTGLAKSDYLEFDIERKGVNIDEEATKIKYLEEYNKMINYWIKYNNYNSSNYGFQVDIYFVPVLKKSEVDDETTTDELKHKIDLVKKELKS